MLASAITEYVYYAEGNIWILICLSNCHFMHATDGRTGGTNV